MQITTTTEKKVSIDSDEIKNLSESFKNIAEGLSIAFPHNPNRCDVIPNYEELKKASLSLLNLITIENNDSNISSWDECANRHRQSISCQTDQKET